MRWQVPEKTVLVAILTLAACNNNFIRPPEEVCEQGEEQPCSCGDGGGLGTQRCEEEGALWGDCQCGDAGLDADLDASGDASGDADLDLDAEADLDVAADADEGGSGCVGACPLGCHEAEGRCYRLAPSNFDPRPFHDFITTSLEVGETEEVIFDGDTGEIVGEVVYRAAGGPGAAPGGLYWGLHRQEGASLDLAVFGLTGLAVPAGARLLITGSRPVAIYVTGDVAVGGLLSARARGRAPGPGGALGAEQSGEDAPSCGGGEGRGGAQGGTTEVESEAGGGGGGYGAGGGAGGDGVVLVVTFAGGAGGEERGEAILLPLVGGCGGGAGGGPDTLALSPNDGGAGGGGGGALQIAAGGEILIEASGGVEAGGGGGEGGRHDTGGGGGGSGGAILLEAATIENDGRIAANGGGGGGAGGPFGFGADGEDGLLSTAAASGGAPFGFFSGRGGQGGAVEQPAGQSGANATNGGGGGGGVGRVRLNVHSSREAGLTSPSPSTYDAVGRW